MPPVEEKTTVEPDVDGGDGDSSASDGSNEGGTGEDCGTFLDCYLYQVNIF